MNDNDFKNDNYNSYYAVMEASTNAEIKDLEVHNTKGANFLRFKSCLQDFYGRNRNKRLWKMEQVRAMANAPEIQELIRNNSFVGEAGHPVPATGKPTIERIVTRDPNNCSHRITEFIWSGNELHGIVETLDEGVGSPGYRLMKNIIQGIVPAFSLRSLVPQKKNPDGTIDVLGPGMMICYDRVYLPSHKKAYQDISFPVKEISTKAQFESAIESFTNFVLDTSDKVNYILDGYDPVMESANIDNNGIFGINTTEGTLFIRPENKYQRELKDLWGNL